MNDQKIDLALAFLHSQPASAAAVLEQQPIEHVVAFLRDVPFNYATAVLKTMLPQYSATVFKHFEPSISASFLSQMEVSLVAAIMRYSDKALSKKMLEHLPERTKIACKLLLQYTQEAVGAWAVTNVMVLPSDCTVQEACKRITIEHDVINTDTVYVVNRERQLQGILSVANLLRAAPDAPILAVMKNNPDKISGRTALISAINHNAWANSDTVAVINRNQQIVGVLHHFDLRRGLSEISNTIVRPNETDSLVGIFEVYRRSIVALFNVTVEAVSTTTSKGGQR